MWILLGVTVLLLVAMVVVVIRLLDQSETHVAAVKKVKIRLNDAQFRAKVSEADEVIERDIRKDPDRKVAQYSHWELSRGAMRLIATMKNLETLELSDATIKDSWLRYLEKLPLRKIDLAGTSISDAGVKHLAKIKTLEQVKLYDTNVSGKTIEILEPLENLRVLQINGTKTTDEDLPGLLKFHQLINLDLSATEVTEAGCETLSKLDSLLELELSHLPQSIVSLQRLQRMKSLAHLRLHGCEIDDEKAELIGKFPHLTLVDVTDNPLGDKGLEALSKLSKLELITIVGCKNITKTGIEKFRKKRPTVHMSIDKRVIQI